jgi:hypothetical protein
MTSDPGEGAAMVSLLLTFVLTTSPLHHPVYAQRVVGYATAAECQRARIWWMHHTDSELPGMNPSFQLLLGPSCHQGLIPAVH